MPLRAWWVVALTASLTGCFYAEASAGTYFGVNRADFIPSVGLSVGIFIDPDPVRVATGGGGDLAWTEYDGGDVFYGPVGGSLRLDVTLLHEEDSVLWWRATGLWFGPGVVSIRPRGESEYREVSGYAHGALLGGTLAAYFGTLGLHVTTGPYVLVADARDAGSLVAIGPQIRVTIGACIPMPGYGTTLCELVAQPGPAR